MSSVAASRYTWGGDEHLVVQLAEAMSLQANFTAMAISRLLESRKPGGVTDVCPANASVLIRFDPDRIAPGELEAVVRDAEREVGKQRSPVLQTRIVEVPVWYDDPFTSETAARFRDRHQQPTGSDLDFAAAENGLASVEAFIERHSSAPWLTSMVGFVAGLPFLYQMVPHDRQLEVPKYLRPRTDTPPLTVGHGGCFGCIYSVRGAGGYQMFGITPVPIFDPAQKLGDFQEFMIFFRPGDIVKFRPLSPGEYEQIKKDVAAGSFRFRQRRVTFSLSDFTTDADACNTGLLEALNGN